MVRNLPEKITPIAIVGAGRVGCSLGLALLKAGYSLRAISCQHQDSAQESRRILSLPKATTNVIQPAQQGKIIFLCLPDRYLPQVIKDLAQSRVNWSGKFVFHTSGLFSSRLLWPLKRKGAKTASFHPIQSFPTKTTPPSHWQNIFISLEGDEEAVMLAQEIVQRIKATPLWLKKPYKPLYHAACALASNYLVALYSLSLKLLTQSGLQEEEAAQVLRPLVNGTWSNLQSFDPATALTGPIVRDDRLTVRHHLRALKPYPLAFQVYRRLAWEAVELAKKRDLTSRQVKAWKRLLGDK